MPYISGGQIVDSRHSSAWSLSFLSEFFWGVINFVVLFFRTIIDPTTTARGSNYTSNYGVRGNGPGPFGPGGRPQRRMGGFRGGSGAPSCPPMAGGG